MRHQKTRHKLSRSASHRKALLANLCKEVIQHERIRTTEAKAKAVKPEVEQLITLAKRGDLHARRQALSTLNQDKFAAASLIFSRIQIDKLALSRIIFYRGFFCCVYGKVV
jgi:large subunit ribosomal protein L17